MRDKFGLDSQKLSMHPHRVSQLLDGMDNWDTAKNIFPLYVEISPVSNCNHACTFCSVDYILEANKGKNNQLDVGFLGATLIAMGKLGVKSVMFAGEGEPLLHKKRDWMLELAMSAGLDVAITTNGVLLDLVSDRALQGCSWVKVSMNAATRETYSKIHRTKPEDFDRVVRNLKDAVKRKGNCTLGAQMVLLPENQHEVALFKKLGEEIGLDYTVVKPFTQSGASPKPQYDVKLNAPVDDFGNMIIRHNAIETHSIPYSKCHAVPYLWAYIMSNGDVYSCSANHLLDDKFNLGNIYTQSFKEIWQGEKRRANWEYVRNELDISTCRTNCRMNQANLYLEDLINGVPHANFI